MDPYAGGLALLALAHPDLAPTNSLGGKYTHRYETNLAFYPAWTDNLEC